MIGTGEIIVILCVVLLLFGGKKLPEFARNLGQGIFEFKKACQGDSNTDSGCSSCHCKENKESADQKNE